MAALASICAGISRYRFNAPPLEFAEREAKNVHEELVARGALGSLLIGNKATKQSLSAALAEAEARTSSGDLVIFYFTGHGGQEPRDDGFEKYLMLADGPLFDAELGRLVRSLPSRRVLLLLDACFSGGMGESLERDPLGQRPGEAEWVQLFASAAPGELSRGVVGGGSEMTVAFLEMLRRSPFQLTYEEFFAAMLREMNTTSHPVHRAWNPDARRAPFQLGTEPVFLRAG